MVFWIFLKSLKKFWHVKTLVITQLSLLYLLKDISTFICFLCLTAYWPMWVIWCRIHPCRKTAVVLFNPQLVGYRGHIFHKIISLKENVIASMSLKLSYFEATVHPFSHYARENTCQLSRVLKCQSHPCW